jgi:uncharacterized membrane protein (UPF0127 family)
MAVLCRLSYSSVQNYRTMIEALRRAGTALLLATVIASCAKSPEGSRLIIETAEGEVELNVEIADTTEERTRGLMNRKELAPNAGMVFVHDTPQESNFWMKDTLIPLSLAVWGKGGTIEAILDMEPCRADPCPIYTVGVPWVGAVEVNQGFFAEHGVKVGDQVRLVD